MTCGSSPISPRSRSAGSRPWPSRSTSRSARSSSTPSSWPSTRRWWSTRAAASSGPPPRWTRRRSAAASRCAEPLAVGAGQLRLTFRGTLNDKLRGFYRSDLQGSAAAMSRTMAATQFEATDARRAFPCWDEPAFKAVFAVTLVIDPALTAVSNTRDRRARRARAARKVVRFADTIIDVHLPGGVRRRRAGGDRRRSMVGPHAGARLVRAGQATPGRVRSRDRAWPRSSSSRTTTACPTRATSST